jgi:ABC-type nitrate/sulfonate/bicarbonate transport system permease component
MNDAKPRTHPANFIPSHSFGASVMLIFGSQFTARVFIVFLFSFFAICINTRYHISYTPGTIGRS